VKELLDALEHDSLPQIKKLLSSGNYDLNSDVEIGLEYELDDYDEIPLLFWAIQSGASQEAIELLLEYGANLKQLTKEGVGALDYAIKYRRKDIVELCKSKGIDLTSSKRKSGLTPLMLAASFNDIDMIKYLIDLGANPKARDNSGMNALDYATKLGQKSAVEFLEKLD
jgi:ankyrin repeat protein